MQNTSSKDSMEKGRNHGKGFLNTSINQQEGCQKYAMAHSKRNLFCEVYIKLYSMKKFKHLYWCTNSVQERIEFEIYWGSTGVSNDTSVQTD